MISHFVPHQTFSCRHSICKRHVHCNDYHDCSTRRSSSRLQRNQTTATTPMCRRIGRSNGKWCSSITPSCRESSMTVRNWYEVVCPCVSTHSCDMYSLVLLIVSAICLVACIFSWDNYFSETTNWGLVTCPDRLIFWRRMHACVAPSTSCVLKAIMCFRMDETANFVLK